ncbi:2-hydroxyacid dehydrogenase [bacterium]|nr:2-hydroxyacid dehydrogenase [bacterium]
MKLSKVSKCLIATPISHLSQVSTFVDLHHDCFLLNENGNRNEIIEQISFNRNIKYLFVNPNAQGYYIDFDFLTATKIKGINTCSTGTNHIDIEACTKNDVEIYNLTTDFELIDSLPSTSELAFGMMLSLCRKLILSNQQVIDSGLWDYTSVMGRQISGMTIGILGYGRLGKLFARMLDGFNVKIIICENDPQKSIPLKYTKVDIEELFEKSDALAIHIHSTPENKDLVDTTLLRKMKKGACLVNTSRGDLVDEYAICKQLEEGYLGGYATDVLRSEFTDIEKSPILNLARKNMYNIIITPHVGGMTFEGQTKAFLYALNKFSFS